MIGGVGSSISARPVRIDYDGPLPQGGYFVARSRTIRVLILGRMFLVNNDPNPAAELIKSRTKIYPYVPGGEGTSIAEFLSGDAKLGRITERRRPYFARAAAS